MLKLEVGAKGAISILTIRKDGGTLLTQCLNAPNRKDLSIEDVGLVHRECKKSLLPSFLIIWHADGDYYYYYNPKHTHKLRQRREKTHPFIF